MPTPRFIELGVPYEIVWFCPVCGWSIIKDDITSTWKHCRLCLRHGRESKLVTRRYNYGEVETKDGR